MVALVLQTVLITFALPAWCEKVHSPFGPQFRVGSGARFSEQDPRPSASYVPFPTTQAVQELSAYKDSLIVPKQEESHPHLRGTEGISESKPRIRISPINFLLNNPGLLLIGNSVLFASVIGFAFHNNRHNNNHHRPNNYGNARTRDPPTWGPGTGKAFSQWVKEIKLWTLATDMPPHTQAAAIVHNLQGVAKEMAMTLSVDELANGGMTDTGVFADPVSYLLHGLHANFGQLDEETRLASMTEIFKFNRRPNESTDSLLARFDMVVHRSREEGNVEFNVPVRAMMLFRCLSIGARELQDVLRPLGGRFPQTEQELRNIQAQLRRTSHIKENAPNNIAHHLSHSVGGRNHAFLSLDDGCCDPENSRVEPDNIDAYPVMMSPMPGTNTQSYVSGNWGNNIWADSHPSTGEQAHPSFAVDNPEQNEPYDSGTDSDTSSDSKTEPIDFTDCPNFDDPNQVSEHLFFQYRHAKRRWRRWSQKPVRRVRRYFKKTAYTKDYGRGKSRGRFGKGRYKSRRSYYTDWRNLSPRDMNEALTYLQREDPSVNVYTSGKGKGRRGNPKGADGNVLKCFDCGSTEHLRAECPQRGKNAQVHFAGGKSGRRKFKHNHGKSSGKSNNPPAFLSLNDPDLIGGQGVDGHMQGQSQSSGVQHEQFMYVDQGAQQSETRHAYLQTAEQQSYRGPLSGILADNDEDEYPEDRHQMAPQHYIVVQISNVSGDVPRTAEMDTSSGPGPAEPADGQVAPNWFVAETNTHLRSEGLSLSDPEETSEMFSDRSPDATQAYAYMMQPSTEAWNTRNDPWSPTGPQHEQRWRGNTPWRAQEQPGPDARFCSPSDPAWYSFSGPRPDNQSMSASAQAATPQEEISRSPSWIERTANKLRESFSPRGKQTSSPGQASTSGGLLFGNSTFVGNVLNAGQEQPKSGRTDRYPAPVSQPQVLGPQGKPTMFSSMFTQAIQRNQPQGYADMTNPVPTIPMVSVQDAGGDQQKAVLTNIESIQQSMQTEASKNVQYHKMRPVEKISSNAALPIDTDGRGARMAMPMSTWHNKNRPRMHYKEQLAQSAISRASQLEQIMYREKDKASDDSRKVGSMLPAVVANPKYLQKPYNSVFGRQFAEKINPDRETGKTVEQIQEVHDINMARMHADETRRDEFLNGVVPNRHKKCNFDDEIHSAVSEDEDGRSGTRRKSAKHTPSVRSSRTDKSIRTGFGGDVPMAPPEVFPQMTAEDAKAAYMSMIDRSPLRQGGPQASNYNENDPFNLNCETYQSHECGQCRQDYKQGHMVTRLGCGHCVHSGCLHKCKHTCPVCGVPSEPAIQWIWQEFGQDFTQPVNVIQFPDKTWRIKPTWISSDFDQEVADKIMQEVEAMGPTFTGPDVSQSQSQHSTVINAEVRVEHSQTEMHVIGTPSSEGTVYGPVPAWPQVNSSPPETSRPPSPRAEPSEFSSVEMVPSRNDLSPTLSEVSQSVSQFYPTWGVTEGDMIDWANTPSGTFMNGSSPMPGRGTEVYHAETRLWGKQKGVLVDPGSVYNLAGDNWVTEIGLEAVSYGKKPKQTAREKPLNVSGVGNGSQQAKYNVKLPLALKQTDGKVVTGTFESPTIPSSGLPALLGLTALVNNRAIIDFDKRVMYLQGPGDVDLDKVLAPGARAYQLEKAPSGHLILPCNHYEELKQQEAKSAKKETDPIVLTVNNKPDAGAFIKSNI